MPVRSIWEKDCPNGLCVVGSALLSKRTMRLILSFAVLLSEADTATAAHRVRLCLCLADTVTAMPIGPVRRPPEQSNERPNAWAMAAARPKMGRPRRADRP